MCNMKCLTTEYNAGHFLHYNLQIQELSRKFLTLLSLCESMKCRKFPATFINCSRNSQPLSQIMCHMTETYVWQCQNDPKF